jgi:hypothetical protein
MRPEPLDGICGPVVVRVRPPGVRVRWGPLGVRERGGCGPVGLFTRCEPLGVRIRVVSPGDGTLAARFERFSGTGSPQISQIAAASSSIVW